ncbi:MAG: hypothetical protein KAH20_01555 [Methylococcales bacterium]|nr:hypothetical protein [Methylococcales bacterium]
MNYQVSPEASFSKIIFIAITLAYSHIAGASALLLDNFNAGTTKSNPITKVGML